MNPKIEEVLKALRFEADIYVGSSTSIVCAVAADLIEELQRELEDERYRHDRYADYCVAADEERSALKERARWIPVEERLPADEGEKFIKYGFMRDGELDDRRFMSAGCYYLHEPVPHWRNEGYAGMKVTHWMDPPPEE